MSTIRTPCEVCGVVLVAADDMVVSVAATNNFGFYEFECPQCDTRQRHKTGIETVSLLVQHGCPMLADSVPAESREVHEGDPITHDDLIDFHELIRDRHRFNAAVAQMTRIDT